MVVVLLLPVLQQRLPVPLVPSCPTVTALLFAVLNRHRKSLPLPSWVTPGIIAGARFWSMSENIWAKVGAAMARATIERR